MYILEELLHKYENNKKKHNIKYLQRMLFKHNSIQKYEK